MINSDYNLFPVHPISPSLHSLKVEIKTEMAEHVENSHYKALVAKVRVMWLKTCS
jgi:hypothetical protein